MPSTIKKAPVERVHEFDGLRGILALWVVLSHMLAWCGLWDADLNLPLHLQGTWATFMSGVPPVDTFIILSGFAITFYLNEQKPTYSSFIKGRFFRIYPVYLVCLVIAIASTGLVPAILNSASWRSTVYFTWLQSHYAYEQSNLPGHIFWHLTLLNGILPKEILPDATGTLLPPAWSITLEWQFYLVAPLLLLLARSGMGLLILTVSAVLANRYGADWQNSQTAFLPAQLPLLLAGMGSYHLYIWLRTLEPKGPKAVVMPVVILFALAVLTFTYQVVGLTIWALCFGAIFLKGDDLLSRSFSILRKLLLHSSLQSMGRISYPLYLIHWPLIMITLRLLLYADPNISSTGAVLVLLLVALPLILLTAIALHVWIEVPGRALGRLSTKKLPSPSTGKPQGIDYPPLDAVKNTTT